MAREKIVIIGGGSAYVPGILYSMAHTGPDLAGSEVCLMDVSLARLPMMQRLARRICEDAGADLVVSETTRVDEALRDATFVLTNFRPGGLEGLRLDETIPDKYGILGQETTGPGGTFYSLRSIPQALALCTSMERLCSDAWLINYVNPANFVADAIRRRSTIRSVTICDGGGNGLKYILSEFLEIALSRIRVRAAGINHHTWLLEFTIDGKDGYPLLRERIQGLTGSPSGSGPDIHRYLDFKKFCLRRYGLFPANDSYLFPYFSHAEAVERYRKGEHSLYKMFERDLPSHWKNFEAMADGMAPVFMDPAKHHTHVGHGDIAVDIIRAMATNEGAEFHVNLPNEGCITNLPYGSIVEVPALVDASGAKPLCMGPLPKGVLGLTAALLNWQELSVDAALSGDVNVVVQALLAHPWIQSIETAEKMTAEMLSAHAAFLPQFAA